MPPPDRCRTLPSKRGREQRAQQLDHLCFLNVSERLDSYRAEPDLTVIDCLGAQRHNLASAARRVVIIHRVVDAPAEEPRSSTPRRPDGYARQAR